jgi:hypothetical protein
MQSNREHLCREVTVIDSKYAKYSTEQLEVIYTHLADPQEKELVKQELSTRYFNYYLGIIQLPPAYPQTGAPPHSGDWLPPTGAPPSGKEETAEPIAGPDGKPFGSLSLEEQLASLSEVLPLKLKLPPSQEAAAPPGPEAPDKPAKKRFCFIATAAYGTPLAPEVVLLQNFRDAYLSSNALGERFIRAYYRLSPPLARHISRDRAARLIARLLLAPIISLVKKVPGLPGETASQGQ